MGRLAKTSKEKYESLHETMLKKGITAEKALQMNAREWKKAFGGRKVMSKDSLEGRKRNIQSLRKHLKTVLDYKFRKRGITNPDYQKAIKKLSNELLKRVKKKKKKKRDKLPPLDIKINGSFQDHKKSVTINSYKELKEFLDDLHKSAKQYSRKYKMIVFEENVADAKRAWRVYQNFDYGVELSV